MNNESHDENHGVPVPGAYAEEEYQSDREALHEQWARVAIVFLLCVAAVLILAPPWGRATKATTPALRAAQTTDAGAP